MWHFLSPIVMTYTSVWHSNQPVPIGYLTAFLYSTVTVFYLIYHCYSTYVNSLSHSHRYTSSVLRRTLLTSHKLKSQSIVWQNSFNIIASSFFSLYLQSITFLSHPLAQVLPNHTRNANAFFFTWCIVFVLFNCPLATLQTRNVYNCIMFQKLAISPYSHSQPNSVFISQSSVFLWTCKLMSVRNHPKRLHTKS